MSLFSFRRLMSSPTRRPYVRPENRRNRIGIEHLEDRVTPSASIWTDQPDYAPGSTAIINGTGFTPGSTVTLQVVRTDGIDDISPANDPFEVSDGGAGDDDGLTDGNIQTSWYVDPYFEGATLRLSATDVSGEVATWDFTDGTLTGVSVDTQTGTATYGSSNSVTFNIDVTGNGGNPRTWTLSFTGLPTGVSGSFSVVNGNGFGGPNDSVLTLNTTGTGATRTPPGIYTFSVTVTGTGGTAGGPFTANGTLTVGKKALTVTGITANDKTYDGNTAAALNTGGATLSGLVAGDSVTLNTAGATGTFANKNAGPGKTVTIAGLTLSGPDASRYTVTQPTATATIFQRALVASLTADDKIYDGTTAATIATRNLAGVISGDNVNLTGGGATFDNRNAGAGKTVTGTGFGLGGSGASNYTVNTTATTTADIFAAPLTITAVTNTKTYDGDATAAAGPTVSGVQTGDSVTDLTEIYDNRNAGTGKTLSVDTYTVNDGNGGNNYIVSTVTNTSGVINQASLTITAVTNTKTYNGTTSAAATPTTSGLVGGDSVSGLSEEYDNRNAGTGKTLSVVTGFTVNDGNGGNNYVVNTVADTTGVINKAALTITAVTNTKTYDGTTSALATPLVSGLQDIDTVSGLSEKYDNRNAGTGKTLSVATYAVNDGNSGDNYDVFTVVDTTGVINQASLTITAITNTKTYDGTTSAAATPTVSGLQDVDTASGLSETYDNRNAGTGKTLSVATYAVNDGNGGNNYIVSTVANTTGVINKAAITITAVTNTKTYDSNTSAAAIPTVSGVQTGDSVTGLSEAYLDPNAGTGKTLVVTGYVVNDGNSGNNYTVSTVANTTGIIVAKSLTGIGKTETSINISKAGVISFKISGITGMVNSESVASLFNGATFHLKIGANTYSVTATASVDSSGTVMVSWHMSAELQADLLAVLNGGTPSDKTPFSFDLWAYSTSGNYKLDALAATNLFVSGKLTY